jgi:hypothetical protein
MTESDKIRGIIESAVESAFIDFPHMGHEETWPQKLQRECGVQDLGDSRPLVAGKMGLQNRSGFCSGRKNSRSRMRTRTLFSDRPGA